MGQVGDFELIDALGQGGMGIVWRARHRGTGEVVALKMVSAAVEGAVDGLRREIRALAMIEHPGVIRVVAEGIVEGQPWYAMELLEGTTLRKRLARTWGTRFDSGPTVNLGKGSVAPASALDAHAPTGSGVHASTHELLAPMIALCDALAHVHAAGLVHRDLTPDNIWLRRDGRPVLVDFGLVSRVSRGAGRDVIAVGGTAVGTAPYMAPEQIRGEVVDVRADLYALGCILYEIATGVPPFTGANVTVIMSNHLFDEALPPSARNPEVPVWLDDVVLGLLAKHPRDRTGSASDVAAALARGLGRPRSAGGTAPLPIYRPRLAGREQVIAMLEPMLVAGGSDRILIAGPSGVGKTRLVVELAQRAAADGIRVIAGECVALSAERERSGPVAQAGPLHPLRPLLQVVADRCQLRGPEETARLLGKVGDALIAFEPALAQVYLSPDGRGAPPAVVDPVIARDRVLAALRHVVAGLAATQPLLLVLDDLQWADELTLQFLASLRGGARGVMVIATSRDDVAEPELVDATDGWVQIALGALPHAAVRAIAEDMLGTGTLEAPPPLVDAIVELCEGVPFYIAEYLRYAIDDGVLARPAGGSWLLARPVSELPSSPGELMNRRIDQLAEATRDVVAAAAVLGRTLDAGLLPTLTGHDDHVVAVAVRDLLRQQVLEEAERGQLRFRHDKLREAAYDRLPAPRRREAHHLAAQALEARAGSRPAQPALWPVLAHHWSEANQPARAIEFLERAADHALAAGAYRDAISFLTRARRHVTALAEPSAHHARWDRKLAEAAWYLGDLEGVARHATASLAAMGHPIPDARPGWTRTLARELVRRTVAWGGRGAPGAGDAATGEAALALHRLGYSYFHGGKVLATFATTIWSANLADRSRRPEAVSMTAGSLGYLQGMLGLTRPAAGTFARGRAAAQQTGDPAAPAVLAYQEAAWLYGRARWAEAEATCAQALADLREAGHVHEVEVALSVIAHVAHSRGRYAVAEEACGELLASSRARASTMHEAWGLYTVARERWARGALDEAAALLDEAERVLARPACRGDRASRMFCAALAARNHAMRGDRAAAAAALARGEGLAAGMPQIFTLDHAYAALAEAAAALGDDAALARARGALWRFAAMFPVARPAAILATAALARQRGHLRTARVLAGRALSAARHSSLPREQVGALRELGDDAAAREVCAAHGLAPAAVGLSLASAGSR